jgi:hypothetical protein
VGPKADSVGPFGYGALPGEVFVSAFSGGTRQPHYSNDDGETFTQRFAPPVAVRVLVAARR